MSPWNLSDQQPESSTGRRIRTVVAILLIAGALFSLVISPMSWQLFLIFAFLGTSVGLLAKVERVFGGVGLILLMFGVQPAATALSRVAPQWHSAWWQPILIAVAAAVTTEYGPRLIRESKINTRPSG